MTGDPTGVMLQIGTRNTQNFELLKTVGSQRDFPILLKRGFGITLHESLLAAEYVASEGNRDIVFCLRGMKTNFGDPHRNLVDFGHVPAGQAPHAHAGVRGSLAFGGHARRVPRGHPRRLPRRRAGRGRGREHGAGRHAPGAAPGARGRRRRRSRSTSCRGSSRTWPSRARPTSCAARWPRNTATREASPLARWPRWCSPPRLSRARAEIALTDDLGRRVVLAASRASASRPSPRPSPKPRSPWAAARASWA